MRKDTYETPYMDRVQVVMEEGIMVNASAGEEPTDTQGGLNISEQDAGVAIGGDGNGWSNGWEADKWDGEQ